MPPEQNLPTPTVSESHYQKRFLIIGGIVVLLFILIGIGVYFWFSMHKSKTVVAPPAIQSEELHKAELEKLPTNPIAKTLTNQDRMNILKNLTAHSSTTTKKITK